MHGQEYKFYPSQMYALVAILLTALSVMLYSVDEYDVTSRLVTNQIEMLKAEFEMLMELKASGRDDNTPNTYKLHEDKCLTIMTNLFNMKSEVEKWNQCSEKLKATNLMMETYESFHKYVLEKEKKYDAHKRLQIEWCNELMEAQLQQKKGLKESLDTCQADLSTCKNIRPVSCTLKDFNEHSLIHYILRQADIFLSGVKLQHNHKRGITEHAG